MLITIRPSKVLNSRADIELEKRQQQGFSLLELILVISLIALVYTTVDSGFGGFSRFREDRFITDLVQIMEFLHQEAKGSQQFYQLEFNMQNRSWRAGMLRPDIPLIPNIPGLGGRDQGRDNNLNDDQLSGEQATSAEELLAGAGLNGGVGALTFELADFLNPPLGNAQSFMPPPDFPSLSEERLMPGEAFFTDIKTPRGEITVETGQNPYVIFSPRGFTEFAVIHIKRSNEEFVTLVTNPFSGEVEIHQGFKEFQWTYDAQEGL